MNVHEAAKRLGKGESTIRRWIREGKLEALIINGTYDIPESAINQPLISHTITDEHNHATTMRDQIELQERENRQLIEQLSEKDKQISELHQLLLVSENRNQKMLEYHQTPFWRRWFGKKTSQNRSITHD
jgi:excisionase family DNA binding protein